jgi:hypothetical protein
LTGNFSFSLVSENKGNVKKPKGDLKKMLVLTDRQLVEARYTINKCLTKDSMHLILLTRGPQDAKVFMNLPCLLKISLKNHNPPLSIQFKQEQAENEVCTFRVFISCRSLEPGIGQNEGYFKNPRKINLEGIPEGKFGDLKFQHDWLYISVNSIKDTQIQLSA